MRKRRDEKPSGPAGWIDDFLAGLRVHHLHHHFDDVARREELSLGAAQRRPDEHLEGFADRVSVRFDDGVVLKLADDICKTFGIQTNAVRRLEDVAEDVLLDALEERLDAIPNLLVGFADAGAEIHRVVAGGLLFVQQLAEQKVDDFLGERLVARDAGSHPGQMVANVAEHRFQIRGTNEILAPVKPDVFDPLTVARDIGKRLISAAAILMVDLAEVQMIFAVEPDADLGRGHVHVQPQLMFAIPAIVFLALHDHQQFVFRALRAEHRDVHRKGSILIGRSCANTILGVGLDLILAVTVIVDQTAGENLNGLHFLEGRPHPLAADEVNDEPAGCIVRFRSGLPRLILRHAFRCRRT